MVSTTKALPFGQADIGPDLMGSLPIQRRDSSVQTMDPTATPRLRDKLHRRGSISRDLMNMPFEMGMLSFILYRSSFDAQLLFPPSCNSSDGRSPKICWQQWGYYRHTTHEYISVFPSCRYNEVNPEHHYVHSSYLN